MHTRNHAPQSLKDAITKNGIPGLPGGGGQRKSQDSCTPRYPNRARERLKNKQINKSSASLSRGEQVERLQPDKLLVPGSWARPQRPEAPGRWHLPEPQEPPGRTGSLSLGDAFAVSQRA